MNMSDPIADMLTRIRNAGMAEAPTVEMPSSKMKSAVAQVLKDTGFVGDFRVSEGTRKTLTIDLKYTGDRRHRKPVIEGLERVSKPSSRVYVGSQEVPRALGGLGTVILSTPKGILSGREARKANVGGEVLCYIW